MAKALDHIYVHVEKISGLLRVQGLRKDKKDKQTFLFKEEDHDLSKHPAVEKELRGQSVDKYRNVKIAGPALAQYYDALLDEFIFNGQKLKEDLEKSIHFDEEGI